jgi:hypothetical protein
VFVHHGVADETQAHIPSKELGRQFKVSKQIPEDRLASLVDFVAAPHGRVSRQVVRFSDGLPEERA